MDVWIYRCIYVSVYVHLSCVLCYIDGWMDGNKCKDRYISESKVDLCAGSR